MGVVRVRCEVCTRLGTIRLEASSILFLKLPPA
eukprot:COSAG04_NODE_22515_length_353_cov_1.279528_1_plen_32_part_10